MRRSTAILLLAALCSACAACAACASGAREPLLPPDDPASLWTPPPEMAAPPPAERPGLSAQIPPEAMARIASGEPVELPELVDLALASSPRTREAWLAARAAAEEVGTRRADYYPRIDTDLSVERVRQSAVGNQFSYEITQGGPSVDISYLLFAFGGRKADVEEARQALAAADWEHNAEIQDLVLDVTQSYYAYLGQKALLRAAESDRDTFGTNLEAAEHRHDAGVATIADVLQARTALSQTELDLLRIEGDLAVVRGALATTVGVSPAVPLDAGELPEDVPVEKITASIDQALDRALAERPDLAAARARAAASRQALARTRSEGLPRISLEGGASRIHYDVPDSDPSNNYSGRLIVRYPLFTGFRHLHEVRQAEADAEAAEARVDDLAQRVMLQVWTAWYDLQTAARRVETSRDLLASAEQSAEVAGGRYQSGVGNVLDLLTAQSALANARAQEVQARAAWFLALAQLAHDTGVLRSAAPVTLRSTPSETPSGAEP